LTTIKAAKKLNQIGISTNETSGIKNMTTEPDYDERLKKLRILKEKLGAQEKELEKLLARLEDAEAKRAAVINEIGSTLNNPQFAEEPPQE
jgi:uncharacterized tellurite resistance protein B-like protein